MTENLIPKKVRELEEYRPNMTPCRVRLDANESPFLPSKAVLDELAEAVYSLDFNRYPDPYATELTEAFARLYGVPGENVVAGNGSDELISLIAGGLVEHGDTVAVVLPDFSMYEFYSTLAGAKPVKFIKSESFEVDFSKLFDAVCETGARLVIFSNPCNPTGWVCPRDEIEGFIKKTDALVVVDEAYMEFSQRNESVIELTQKYSNLTVLKTMSKAYGAAALRLGFAISGKELTGALRKIKSPYNVNTVSQVFGKIILSHHDEIKANIEQMRENLTFMRESIIAIKSDKIERVCPTAANFVYVKMISHEAACEVFDALMARGVAIRCMKGGYIRICAGTREECEIFLNEFSEVLA